MTRVLLALGLGAVMAALPAAQARQDLSPKAVSAAAAAYVAAYQEQLQYVVADEDATQVVFDRAADPIQRRHTRADLFVTWLPADGSWISVRDVRDVDGTPVSGPDDLRTLLASAPLSRLGAIIAEKNARYNIGDVRRTFNEPTLALLALNARHVGRFRFERKAITAGAAGPVVTLAFREKDEPTLIRGMARESVFMRGEMTVNATTGRVERTTVELAFKAVRAVLTTVYAEDPKLGFWVPATMSERYAQQAGPLRQTITVESTYANYRRYETTSRIK